MLRVRTLHASSAAMSAAYYTRYLAEAPGEVPGVWAGHQADGLGLAGAVTVEQLEVVLEGRDPVSGMPLGNVLKDRTVLNGKTIRAVAGFDATFSAPKSVSLWWGLTRDTRVLDAHDVAVTAALDYLERFGSTTRVRSNGRRLHPNSQGLTIAAFRQATSRADDPQIHTHAVVSAKVQTEDGRWLALDARFLKRHQRKLGGLYQSVLRNELSHRFGVEWQPIVNGQAEIAGFPEELIVAFSKRAAEVDEAVRVKVDEFRRRQAREPTSWERAALTREAAADTRGRKTGVSAAELRSEWLAEAALHGWSPRELVEQITTAGRDQTAISVQPLTVEEIVEALSTRGSTWGRAEVLQAICDVQRPVPGLSGRRWAAALEQACDQVLGRCIDLDPDNAGARRASDGRSLWLDPSSPHITSERVLTEEEHVLSWAIDAQASDPTPSETVDGERLDVLQADVAAAVAGYDRLVLAVGPAGTGKTTALRVAVEDLTRQGRVVFGLSPTAKAARVLEHGTGVRAETVAKLLHEWSRGDRPPLDEYRLPPGATVVVDEAGMLGTGALHRLITLAEHQQWRLVLIGDHRQLQAVGRGGMFHELCTTGRCHELQRIHRFDQRWEAAASLQLRHGDPRALDAYESHDRILPGTIDEHLAHLSDTWLRAAADGNSTAITTSTNEHVDLINAAIQHARVDAGQLGRFSVVIGGERAHAGDIVATRRNDRQLITTAGEPVRNRELWTVRGVHQDGSLTVSPQIGHGQITLPADYTSKHVRLGYAATEYGNQSDTVTISAELVTPAATCRGLYVGMTRGRQQNLLLVVTEQHDLTEARDVLERVLAADRADIPATTVRRQLAEEGRTAGRLRPVPRCAFPDWLGDLQTDIAARLTRAQTEAATEAARRAQLTVELDEARRALAVAERRITPHRSMIDAADAAIREAQGRVWSATSALNHPKRRRRRHALRDARDANRDLAAARNRQADIEEHIAPVRAFINAADSKVRDLEQTIQTTQLLDHWDNRADRAREIHELAATVDEWRTWAAGKPLSIERIEAMTRALQSAGSDHAPACAVLAATVQRWAHDRGVDLPPVPRLESSAPAQDLGIEL